MPQGPLINDNVRMLAAKLHEEHPKWTNEEIRNWVLDIVHKNDPSLPKGWPSKYSVDRIMPGIRERARLSKLNPDPRDKPWTIQSMNIGEYHIPPEALPSVLQAWHRSQDLPSPLTIREAQWAARLYAAVTDTDSLCAYSRLLAGSEKRAKDAGIQDFTGSQIYNLYVFSTMTGHIITHEQEKRLSGWSDKEWDLLMKIWPTVREQIGNRKPKGVRPLRLRLAFAPDVLTLSESSGISERPEEAQNERRHKAKKQR